MKKTVLLCFTCLYSLNVFANYLSWEELEQRFSKLSKHPKALGHVRCFFEKHAQDKFQLKVPDPGLEKFYDLCYGNPQISLGSTRVFAIADYTVDSDEQRLFLIDRATGEISKMAVAHGRYKAGFFNLRPDEFKNTIKEIKYYSNTVNSMASSSGFFIAGQDHLGEKFGRSLVIHGLEMGINDNACERDVVIHKHFLMTKHKAHMLSSGCLMVSPSIVDHVITLLRGEADEDMILQKGGSLVFIYGPREEAWEKSTCPGNFNIL
ncbi:MAG: murein L,D-transpeptidase catalytic domain-containing protein [Bacteriovorax sp.]